MTTEEQLKLNCYFYDFGNETCRILKRLYCEKERKCKFFKTQEQYERDKEKYDL